MTRISLLRATLLALVPGLALALAGLVHAAPSSYWKLGAAPAELAAYGYTQGVRFFDDATATYYLAEHVPYVGYTPPDVVIVTVMKDADQRPLVATEPANVTDGSDTRANGRRIAAAESERFNRVVFPALIRAQPQFARAPRLTQFFYAQGRHFQPTRFYRERQLTTKTGFEEALLELPWQRDAADFPFAPHPRLLAGVPADGLPVTLAEATRGRAPASAAPALASAASVKSSAAPVTAGSKPARGSAPGASTSSAATSRAETRYTEAVYCATLAGALKDTPLKKRWMDVSWKLEPAVAASRVNALRDTAIWDASVASALEGDKARSQTKAKYAQCQSRIAAVEQAVAADIAKQVAERRATKQRARNAHAPTKIVWHEQVSLLAERDPAKIKKLRADRRAWDAYCRVAGDTLVMMSERNPAAFGIDPRKHPKLVKAIRATGSDLKSQWAKSPAPDGPVQAKSELDQQTANYDKGLKARKNERDVASFVKEQVFQCSDGFEGLWDALLLESRIDETRQGSSLDGDLDF